MEEERVFMVQEGLSCPSSQGCAGGSGIQARPPVARLVPVYGGVPGKLEDARPSWHPREPCA